MCDEGDNDITRALPATGKKREEMKEVALVTYTSTIAAARYSSIMWKMNMLIALEVMMTVDFSLFLLLCHQKNAFK